MQELILYHYVHCPYCVRVRMALGKLNIDYQSIVLPYDDEETPVKLTGVKMLPIMKIGNHYQNESLDIIENLDSSNFFDLKNYRKSEEFQKTEEFCVKLSKNVHNLAMPYWVFTPEFNDKSRDYFIKKKSAKRGPFHLLVQKSDQFILDLNKDLDLLEKQLQPFYQSKVFSFKDIQIASFLWGMYIVPEFQFSPSIHKYLQNIKNICNFNYHKDFWV